MPANAELDRLTSILDAADWDSLPPLLAYLLKETPQEQALATIRTWAESVGLTLEIKQP